MTFTKIEKQAAFDLKTCQERRPLRKTILQAALIGFFGALGSSLSLSALAQAVPVTLNQLSTPAVPMTMEQARVKSTQAFTLDPTASKDRDLRAKAMQEAAQSYGARSGLMRRTYEIKESINTASGKMDAIWNFQPLMLTDAQPGEVAGVLRQRLIIPAVVTQAQTIFKQASPGMVQFVDRSFKIESQPRFSSVTPTWRDYLFRDLGETAVNPPHVSLLPRTPEEKTNWGIWIAQGWESGVTQANDYLEYDLRRLKRDWDGMITYHEMVAQKMVSLPHVATSNEGVTGDDTTMNINDSMLRITVLPAFQRDSKNWVPLQSGK